MLNNAYTSIIHHFLTTFEYAYTVDTTHVTSLGLFKLLFDPKIYTYYLANYFTQWETLEKILRQFDFPDLLEVITACYPHFSHWHKKFISIILETLDVYCCVDANEYDSYFEDCVRSNTIYGKFGCEVNEQGAASDLRAWIEEELIKDTKQALKLLPSAFTKDDLTSYIEIDVIDSHAAIESYVRSMYEDDDDNYHTPSDIRDYAAIDAIFDR